MVTQGVLTFDTASPINVARLGGQNKRLYEYLLTGKSIHCLHDAKKSLRIGYLNSRISDLANKHNIDIKRVPIKAADVSGELVDVIEYSLNIPNAAQ